MESLERAIIEEIAANLARLEKKVEFLSSSENATTPAHQAPRPAGLPPRPAVLYSEKVTGGKSQRTQPKGPKDLPAVSNAYIKRFKLGQVVIRKRFDQPKPFEGRSAAQIAVKINEALEFAQANIDQVPITVKAVVQFPNGDIKKADSKFITTQTLYLVLLHSCPTNFEVDKKDHVITLCSQNDIDPAHVYKIRLLNPRLHLAHDIERAGLCYNSLHLNGQHCLQGPK
ncbi:hypothetical protein VP01_35g8 [Puccinia sorghi]|uniref:Uncharacterized protein n=1 Tax=Puccinia sorghi TaxID=27349 RepID=A0A0L6UV65_9BASI|nr:hypothetical protein VP01_35g8 [Puccinia sorghi]